MHCSCGFRPDESCADLTAGSGRSPTLPSRRCLPRSVRHWSARADGEGSRQPPGQASQRHGVQREPVSRHRQRAEHGLRSGDVQVHHIRKLADLEKPGRRAKPAWVKQMAARRRKTLIVCRKCHEAIHAGTSTASFRKQGLESRMTPKGSSPVWEEGNEKGP